MEDQDPVERIVSVVAATVPGCPAIPVIRAAPDDDPIVALGRAVDRTTPGFATQAADVTLRALTLACWASAAGGADRFARSPTGGLTLATWAALDVVLSLGALDLARSAAPHLEPQRTRLLATGTPLRPVPWSDLVGVLQERIDAAATAVTALKPGIEAVLWNREGRLAVPPDRLVFYGWLGARVAAGV